MQFNRFLAILKARNLEFMRDRSALAWNVLLPVLIVLGFAFAFTTKGVELYKVGIHGDPQSRPALQPFLQLKHIAFIPLEKLQPSVAKVQHHQLDMLLDMQSGYYWINQNSAKGYILEQLLSSSHDIGQLERRAVSGAQIRYVDWLLPGVLGMNVMFSSLFGVGYVIVRYRKNGVLKRLKATPLSAFEFLLAQVVSRLWLIMLVTSGVYIGTHMLVGFTMYGSYWTLLLVLATGTLSMISLGLIIAARLANEEAANGLLNAISWPMMLLSGVWFSLDGSPEIVQQLALFFPLTHMIEAARGVMLDGAGFYQIAHHLAVMLLMTCTFMLIGARSFRWE